MPTKESAAARAAGARSAGASPMPTSPKQGSVPASSVNSPHSSLPRMKKQKPGVRTLSMSAAIFAPSILAVKKHFEGKQEKLMKERLNKRDFSYVRHDCYDKDLTKPHNRQSLSYADPHRKEFWQTDVERVVKREEDRRRARQKELLAIWANKEAWRRHHATTMREMKHKAYVELNERMQKIGCRNNKSGAPHINIITREAIGIDPFGVPPTFQEDVSKYKAVQRKLLLREKMSGARNYNILNWTENAPGPELPPWPEKPPTQTPPPPPRDIPDLGLNSSKGALSYARLFGPFGVINTQ